MCTRFLSAMLVLGMVSVAAPAAPKEKNLQEPSQVLTLESAVHEAVQQNPELKALAKDAEAAQTKISRARYWDDTMVGVRFYQVPFTEPLSETEDIDYIIRQKFPLGGKPKAMSQMAYHEYQHRLHLLNGRGREILRDLKKTYYDLFAVQRMIGVNREMEGNLRSIVQTSQAKLAINQAMAMDATQGQTEIAKVLFERESLVQERKELEARLKGLMASSSPEEIRLPAKLEMPDWDIELDRILVVAQERHPSLEAEKHHVEEQEWGVKAAKREYIPDLNVQTEYVQRPGGRGDAFTGELMLNVPLIVRKKSLGVKQAEAELASAQFMRQAKRNEVVSKVKELYAKLQASGRILKINRGTYLGQARQSYQSALSAYSTGKGAFSDMLNAARMLFDAQMSYWKNFGNYAAAVFELEEAVGLTREEFSQWSEQRM